MAAYLFDTDALSEIVRPRPSRLFIEWLSGIPHVRQYTSVIVLYELYKGGCREDSTCDISKIETHVLPRLDILPFSVEIAKVAGAIEAALLDAGRIVDSADIQIAATALYNDMEVVTGNLRHFGLIPGIKIKPVLADARRLPH